MKRTRYDDVCEELVNSPRRWLVTGVAGFIGSALLVVLLWRQFDHIVHAGDVEQPAAAPA